MTMHVTMESTLIGTLVRSGGSGMVFAYDSRYLESPDSRAISLSLPLQPGTFPPETSRAWFANLLPEGDVRLQVARRLGVSERNEFALLAGIGGECAGALRLVPAGDPDLETDGLEPLPWERLETLLATEPRPALLALMLQDLELRLSLAGAQDKLPVHLEGDTLSLPRGRTASTHLLKAPSPSFPDLVQNEFFCMRLARAVGLEAAPVRIAPTSTPLLLVERYDRRIGPAGQVVRLHQEDVCQALGLPPETKYENEGGPSLAQVFDLLPRASARPLPDRRELLRWVLFNNLIGNADTHAKNLSLVMGTPAVEAPPRLAPFYDLVSTAAYEALSPRIAQKIGGEYRPRFIIRRHWDRFSEEIGVKPPYLHRLGCQLCETIRTAAPGLADEVAREHGGRETLEQILDVIRRRTDQFLG